MADELILIVQYFEIPSGMKGSLFEGDGSRTRLKKLSDCIYDFRKLTPPCWEAQSHTKHSSFHCYLEYLEC
jgi:hypothetical protein